MSMITKKEWDQEEKYLQHVMEVINDDYQQITAQRAERSGDLQNYRRYLWENRRDFNNLYEIAEYEDRLREDLRGYQVVSDRQALLEKAMQMPYFGRIDFRELDQGQAESLYIGLTSIINREKFDILVTDWRAPAASMYYDYEIGPASYLAPDGEIEGHIVLKRQFKVKKGQLILAVDTGIRIDDDILLETLSKSRNPRMQQIVYSIQREQNQIIRDRSSRYLWIQGVAGSGKTSIALHRIAYLLYHRRQHLRAENFVIFSPNQIFLDYISDVLPELGEENTRQFTFFDCAVKTLAPYNLQIEDISEQLESLLSESSDLRTSIANYKMSPEFNSVLTSYLQYLQQLKWRFKKIIFARRCVFTAQDAEYLFNVEYAHLPLAERIEQVVNRIVYLVSSNYKSLNEEKLRQAVLEAFPKINAYTLYRRLFNELNLWEDIGPVSIPNNLKEMSKYTNSSLNKGKLLYEDVAPLMYLQAYLEGLNIDGGVRHVVIDEAQDYTILQLKLLKLMFADADFTVLGDINQAIHPLNRWKIKDASSIFKDKCKVIELNKCYRSTVEIARLADFISPNPNLKIIERRGITPALHQTVPAQLAQALKSLIERLTEHESIAIICKTLKRCQQVKSELEELQLEVKIMTGASRQFSTGLTVLPSYVSKGLEFDAVIIIDADEQNYGGTDNRNLLYTLTTRALHDLHLFAAEPLEILTQAARQELIVLKGER